MACVVDTKCILLKEKWHNWKMADENNIIPPEVMVEPSSDLPEADQRLLKTGDNTQQKQMESCLNIQDAIFDVVMVIDVGAISRLSILTDRSPVVEIICVMQDDKEEWVDYKVTMQFPGDMERQIFIGNILDVKDELRDEGDDEEGEMKEDQLDEEDADSNEEGATTKNAVAQNV